MKPLSLTPALAVLAAMGVVAANAPTEAPAGSDAPIRIAGIPSAAEMIRVDEGSPFLVPAGKILVVTATGSSGDRHMIDVEFDGSVVLSTVTNEFASAVSPHGRVVPIPAGLVARAGTSVEPKGTAGTWGIGILLGYLHDTQAPARRIAGIADPSEMMRVVQGQPFLVPPGKAFVVTGVGAIGYATSSTNVLFDGVNVMLTVQVEFTSMTSQGRVVHVPPGLTAREGVTVEPQGWSGPGVLLGYLTDL